MNHERLSTRAEIARTLNGAVRQALADEASRAAIVAARDAAQLLALPGLDRVIEVLLAHLGRPRPAELTPVLERLSRLVDESAASQSIDVFAAADRELAALAGQLQALEWSETAETLEGRAPAIPTLSLADVLEDLPLADPESHALRLRVTAPVAAALRAAIDWLVPLRGPAQPLQLRAQESVLEITRDHVNHAGLRAADKVLSTVGGNLGPTFHATPGHPAPSWTLRVPTFAGRGSFLMVTQGSLRLALPWHSVLNVCLVPASDLNSALRTAGHPVLEPLMPLGRAAAEYPVVLVAHGLKRAYLVADRLVWRLRAQPLPSERAAPDPVLAGAVETEDGDVFWAIEPGRLLARVETPVHVEPIVPEALEPVVLGPENVEPLLEATVDVAIEMPLPLTAPEVAPEFHAPVAPTRDSLPVSPVEAPTRGSVFHSPAEVPTPVPAVSHEPIFATAAVEIAPAPEPKSEPPASVGPPAAPIPPASAAPSVPPSPSTIDTSTSSPGAEVVPPPPIPPRPRAEPSGGSPAIARAPAPTSRSSARPRALVVEDSIMARVFLGRLLEQQGYEVHAVGRAAEIDPALDPSWSLICVDVDLPDTPPESIFPDLIARARQRGARVVALVRDVEDMAVARAVGVEWTLTKPFDRESIEILLGRLGGEPENR